MSIRFHAVLIALVASVSAAVIAQTKPKQAPQAPQHTQQIVQAALNVKFGQWTVNSTSTRSPVQTDPSKLTDAQKMQQQFMMQGAGAKPTTQVSKECITKEKLNDILFMPDQQDEHCTQTLTKNTANVLDATLACTGMAPMTGTVHIAVSSPTAASGKFHLTVNGMMNIDSTFTATWTSDSCSASR